MANKRISIADLEFDGIKQNLKNFLQGQSKFSDYDFEGSNMSILLDLLAYNTHYNALYSNMALNELYLDSATKRNSVVSLATALGYTPRSYRAARVYATFTVTGVSPTTQGTYPSSITLLKYTPFSGVKDTTRYTFSTKEALTATLNQGATNSYTFTNVELIEGIPVNSNFEFRVANNNFTIPNKNIDLSTLIVRVQEGGMEYKTYTQANLNSEIDGTSRVYFIKEVDELFSISFGDNVLGKQPEVGAFITVSYFVCAGEEPNGIKLITYSGDSIQGGGVTGLTIAAPANGGRNIETIEEIKFNAPNIYAAQDRAVTAADYEALLLSKVPEIEAVSVWGGENNVPPVYGKVFISAKTVSGRNLTDVEQAIIKSNIIDRYKLVSIVPEFKNPSILEIIPNVVLYYDPAETNKSPGDLQTFTTNTIIQFDEDNLQKFKKVFRLTALQRSIEEIDLSILSVVIRMKLKFRLSPVFNVSTNYTISTGNPIARGTLKSSNFYETDAAIECFIDDDGSGVLRLYRLVNRVFTFNRNVGTVNYDTCTINIENLRINSFTNSDVIFTATPSSNDVVGLNNYVLQFDRQNIAVNVIADTSSSRNVNSFIFTDNRIA